MTTAGTRWPTRDEYDIAVAHWTETIWDADIRSGTLAYDNMGICRFGGANLYVSIYKVGDWMMRCFCSKPGKQTPFDITERYMAIDRFCRANFQRVSALLPVTYLEQGITVGMRVLPLVKMPFLAGCPSLGEFLMDTYSDRSTMQRLSDAWLCMIRELEAVSMAHGDLDLTNVLVQQQGTNLTLKLIDYDNTWIPELAGRGQTEYGHTNFQHPLFLPPRQRPYNAEMDRFSALVMYISLKTLVTHPELYEDWGADESDRLLFSEADYQNAGLAGGRIEQLRLVSSPELYPYIDELSASLREGRMPRSLSVIPSGPSLLQFTSQPARPTQPPRPVAPLAPALADWSNVVYNPNAPFATPSPRQPLESLQTLQFPQPLQLQSPGQPMNGLTSNGTTLLTTSPWRPIGPYQHADDTVRLTSSSSTAQSTQPTQPTQPSQLSQASWGQQPGVVQLPFPAPVSMPPQPLFPNGYANYGGQQVPSPLPTYAASIASLQPTQSVQQVQSVPPVAAVHRPPMHLPSLQQRSAGVGSSQPSSQIPQSLLSQQWGMGDMGGSQLQAPPLSVSHPAYPNPTPLPSINEEDLPIPLSLPRRKVNSKKVLTIVAICLLVLIIIVAGVALVMIFITNGHHISIGEVPVDRKQLKDMGAISIAHRGRYL